MPLPATVLTEKRTLIPSHEHIHTDTHHNGITTPLRPFDYTRESRITEHTQKPVNNTGVYSVGRRWLAYIHIRIRGPCTCKRGHCCTEVGTDALEGANFPRSSAVPPVCPYGMQGRASTCRALQLCSPYACTRSLIAFSTIVSAALPVPSRPSGPSSAPRLASRPTPGRPQGASDRTNGALLLGAQSGSGLGCLARERGG